MLILHQVLDCDDRIEPVWSSMVDMTGCSFIYWKGVNPVFTEGKKKTHHIVKYSG